MSVVIGQPLYINCPVSGTPPPQVTWYKDDQVVSPELDPNLRIHANGRRLEIVSAKVTDRGRYQCVGENVAGETLKNYTVDVYVPPKINKETINSNPNVIVNTTAVVNCPVSGIPTPEILWYRNGVLLDSNINRRFEILADGRQLRIHSAKVKDRGRYTCSSRNRAGEDSTDFNLTVWVPPSIEGPVGVSEVAVKEEESITLYCNVTGIPPPEIIWSKNNDIIDPQDENMDNLRILLDGKILKVLDASTDDTARYICQVKNKAGVAEKFYNLEVLVPPKINGSDELQVVPVIMDQSVRLECPAVGIPTPVIRWYRQGKQIPLYGLPNVRIIENGRVLIIISAQLLDFGDYSCQVQNDAGKDKLEFLVSILGK
ncbi:hypothetical protein LOTGIDRAFT_144501 [Lottia gigantea]|uniref:Ig-like domain-containing protein n=1 Tax=Lottia gigantea TaxID=225164 RepID=V4AG48_LOTGI|nr:hypothetical protein LOTGIDRAFT_144501 [Lottia gigantea]ESO95847.1 hypothetical protein LOTGIDRAFT_144501 [Lottia gigantea]